MRLVTTISLEQPFKRLCAPVCLQFGFTRGRKLNCTDQLTAATRSANQDNETYAYDTNGNRDTADTHGSASRMIVVGAFNVTAQ